MDLDTLARVSAWMVLPLSALGAALHFLYDWTGHSRLAAYVSAVNESYWEHIKIAFWPLFLYFLAAYLLGGRGLPGFVPAATVALYAVPVTMVALVYGYKRATKRNVLWVDILAFLVTMALSMTVFVRLCRELAASRPTNAIALAYLAVIVFAFATYSLRPPADPDLFRDPLSQEYGLAAHRHEPEGSGGEDAGRGQRPG